MLRYGLSGKPIYHRRGSDERCDCVHFVQGHHLHRQVEALKIQNAALAQNRDVLELRRIEVERVKAERWNGQLPQNVYAGAPIPFFNVGH